MLSQAPSAKTAAIALGMALALLLPGRSLAAPTESRQTPGSRVDVLTCAPHRHVSTQYHPWIDPYGGWHTSRSQFPYWDAFLAISYRNRAAVAATEVDFGLVARGSLIAVAKDVGSFTKDALIDHEFVVSREIFPIGTTYPYCAVMRVKYADGTEWHNPSPPEP